MDFRTTMHKIYQNVWEKKTHTHNNKIQNILPWNEVFWQEYGSLLWHSNCELIIITKDDMGSVNFA